MSRVSFGLALALGLWPAVAHAGDAVAAAPAQARARALRPLASLPAPAAAAELWVPERRVWIPALGAYAVVPAHREERLSETRSQVPGLIAVREDTREPVSVPAGERLPAEIRPGP